MLTLAGGFLKYQTPPFPPDVVPGHLPDRAAGRHRPGRRAHHLPAQALPQARPRESLGVCQNVHAHNPDYLMHKML